MADLKISQLPVLAGSLLQTTDPLALADMSASETKQITAEQLATGIADMFPVGSIPFASVDGTIPDNSIGTAQLQDGSVTGVKLADDSSCVVAATAPAAGQFLGQVFLNTTDGKTYIWTGGAWYPFQAAGSVNSVAGDLTGLVQTSTDPSTGDVVVSAELSDTNQAAQFAAGPTAQAGAVAYRTIVGTDLPTADASNKGAVVVSGDGLRMDGQNLEIDNDIVAATVPSLCTVDAKGLVTSTSLITPPDLPIATDSTVGVVMPGLDMGVDGQGVLNLDTVVNAGTYTKVTVNPRGIVTVGTTLDAADVPDLPANKLVGGVLDPQVIADHTLEMRKLADYAVSFIQEDQPLITDPNLTIGCYWFQPSIGQLRIYDGNYFAPVGFGRLSQENLRWGGTIDAATGLITGVTEIGVTAGLTIGLQIPEPTDNLGGLYLLVDTAGNGIPVPDVVGVAFDVGDWVLCVNEAEGWIRIDIQGGGGGGGSSTLEDLLDVTITNVQTGQALTFQGAPLNQWVNTDVVNSFNGRTGDVMPAAGDYDIGDIANVVVTNPQVGDVLVYDGSNWVNVAELDGGTY